ncbi:MAG: histidine triad nucleotide-binding protein [Betaproteobacteria bacterium]|nr:histidine triad nucleotide-binding protein [Betaproteobacteria bacterium]MDE2123228.1 histidine triad nucleotide-binding protein [Betaproteobacteria bacterium]MDE2186700.1 histidine triad nucleotide-binding protein [Betaproteobacteria bacterium]
MHDPDCIFCKIIAGTIPSKTLYDDDEAMAFHDINPAAPVHFLLVPKRHIATLAAVEPGDQALLGKMLGLVPRLAEQLGCGDGFKTVINTGPNGGQEVYHLHLHVLGGPRPWKRATI